MNGIHGSSGYWTKVFEGAETVPGTRLRSAVEQFLRSEVEPRPFKTVKLYFRSRGWGKVNGLDEMSLEWDTYYNRLVDWKARERRVLIQTVPRKNYFLDWKLKNVRARLTASE